MPELQIAGAKVAVTGLRCQDSLTPQYSVISKTKKPTSIGYNRNSKLTGGGGERGFVICNLEQTYALSFGCEVINRYD